MTKNYLFTSESVTEGHPDKVCDMISDSILDEYLRGDPNSRVAVETMTTTDFVGVAEPVSLMVNTFGTNKIEENKIEELVKNNFDMRPAGIVSQLDLKRPIYKKTAAYGHFGRNEPEFNWEKTDKAQKLKDESGI